MEDMREIPLSRDPVIIGEVVVTGDIAMSLLCNIREYIAGIYVSGITTCGALYNDWGLWGWPAPDYVFGFVCEMLNPSLDIMTYRSDIRDQLLTIVSRSTPAIMLGYYYDYIEHERFEDFAGDLRSYSQEFFTAYVNAASNLYFHVFHEAYNMGHWGAPCGCEPEPTHPPGGGGGGTTPPTDPTYQEKISTLKNALINSLGDLIKNVKNKFTFDHRVIFG